jgi:RNA polymerase sigma factor (sigma-70 family)
MEERRPALRRAILHAYRYTPLSLDSPLPAGERLSGDWGADPALIAGEQDERAVVRQALQLLPVRQQHVLTLHYYAGKSLHQIGETMQISPQRASQLHQAALKNLRKGMHGSD